MPTNDLSQELIELNKSLARIANNLETLIAAYLHDADLSAEVVCEESLNLRDTIRTLRQSRGKR